jgi:cell division protein FtsW (lipid II flippase)
MPEAGAATTVAHRLLARPEKARVAKSLLLLRIARRVVLLLLAGHALSAALLLLATLAGIVLIAPLRHALVALVLVLALILVGHFDVSFGPGQPTRRDRSCSSA